MLGDLVRIVAGRLDDARQFGPVPMGTVLDLADELRWAASEAVRLCPKAGDKMVA